MHRSIYLKEEVKKILNIGFMEVSIIFLMYTILILLKYFALDDARITKLVPFVSILFGVFYWLKFIDGGRLNELGLTFPEKNKIAVIFIFMILAATPGLIDFKILENFSFTKEEISKAVSKIFYYFIVAFSEELLFRGYIKYKLCNMKKWKWVMTSAVLFAFLHFLSSDKMTMVLFTMLLLSGIVFAVAYENIQSIIPLVAFHMIWDIYSEYSNNYSNIFYILIIWILLVFISSIHVREIKRCRKVEINIR